MASAQLESHHPTLWSHHAFLGAARLSPDNRRLYLARSEHSNSRVSIQCLNLTTGKELWQTEPHRDMGLTAMALSPDGRLLASGSGYEDPTIRIWEAATGRLLVRCDGHTGWVGSLVFSKDGRRLISASGGREAVKLWDVGTRQELLTLAGTGSILDVATWSADGDVILAGAPWQAWRAPSWAEINAAEAKEKAEGKQP